MWELLKYWALGEQLKSRLLSSSYRLCLLQTTLNIKQAIKQWKQGKTKNSFTKEYWSDKIFWEILFLGIHNKLNIEVLQQNTETQFSMNLTSQPWAGGTSYRDSRYSWVESPGPSIECFKWICVFINAFYPKITMNIPIVEQVGFIALCSEREYILWGDVVWFTKWVLGFIIGFGFVFTNFAAFPRIACSWE